jgi:hypothetical protein
MAIPFRQPVRGLANELIIENKITNFISVLTVGSLAFRASHTTFTLRVLFLT